MDCGQYTIHLCLIFVQRYCNLCYFSAIIHLIYNNFRNFATNQVINHIEVARVPRPQNASPQDGRKGE